MVPRSVETRKPHLLYIENLRTVLIIYVILLHLAITYGAGGDWYYKESGEMSTGMFIAMMFVAAVGSGFVLGLFLMLSGYFTPRSYDKKGFGRFLADRAGRLLIPLMFYELLLFPLIRYCVKTNDGYQGSLGEYFVEHFQDLDTIADGPVWFLLTLMIFNVFYALLRLTVRSDFKQRTGVPGNWSIALFALVLGLVTFLTRLLFPVGKIWEPLHQEFAHYPQYIALFIAGTLAYRRNWLENFSDSQAGIWRWVALVCMLILPGIVIAAGALTGELDDRGAGGWNWISFSYSMWEGFTCISLVIICLSWFRKRFDRQSRLAEKMSYATFTAYVIHPVIIVPLAILLSGISMSLDLKFLVVTPAAVAFTFVVSHFFRRLPLIRLFL